MEFCWNSPGELLLLLLVFDCRSVDKALSAGFPNNPAFAGLPNKPVLSAGLPNKPVFSAGLPNKPVLSAGLPNKPVLSAGLPNNPVLAGLPNKPVFSAGLLNSPATTTRNVTIDLSDVTTSDQQLSTVYRTRKHDSCHIFSY